MHFEQLIRHLRPSVLALAVPYYALAARADPETPRLSPSVTAEQKERFTAASQLYKQGRIEQALGSFEQVFESTRSPNAGLYVGHCLVKLTRYVEAYDAFSTTLKEIGKQEGDEYEATREAALAQLSWLTVRVTKLVITVSSLPPDLAVRVDGSTLDPSGLGRELILLPGPHRIEASAPSVQPVTREIEATAGETRIITLWFEKVASVPPPPPLPSSTPAPARRGDEHQPIMVFSGFAAAGAGTAGLALFAIAGLAAKNAYDNLARECRPGACSDLEHRDRISNGKTHQRLANIGLGVGVAGLLAGATLLYFGYSGSAERGVAVELEPHAARVGYRAAF
jgi:tetratricopeptide (TPR) repeat protein